MLNAAERGTQPNAAYPAVSCIQLYPHWIQDSTESCIQPNPAVVAGSEGQGWGRGARALVLYCWGWVGAGQNFRRGGMYSLGVLVLLVLDGHKSGSMHSDYPSCFDHSKEGRGGSDRVCPPRSCELCPAVFRLNAAERRTQLNANAAERRTRNAAERRTQLNAERS